MKNRKHILVGIAGGSASGKTLVAHRIARELGSRRVVVIPLDAYYRELGHLPLEERAQVNFDHPDAFDFELLETHIRSLLRGEPVEVPVYDYAHHNRRPETMSVRDHAIVVLEGILIFWHERLRSLMDMKIFVDTPDDVRLLRRIRRDILERGRKLEGVLSQYESDVRPMHQVFIEPTKRYADIIIPEGGENSIAIDIVRAKFGELLRGIPEPETSRSNSAET